MGLGITHEATIKLKIDYDGTSAAGRQLKSFFDGLNKAVNIERLDSQFQDLRDEISRLNAVLAKTQTEAKEESATLQGELGKQRKAYDQLNEKLAQVKKTALDTARAEVKAAEAVVKPQIRTISALGETKNSLAQLNSMSKKATDGLVAGWTKWQNAQTGASEGVDKVSQKIAAGAQKFVKAEDAKRAAVVKTEESIVAELAKVTAAESKAAAKAANASAVKAFRNLRLELKDLSGDLKTYVKDSNNAVKTNKDQANASARAAAAWNKEFTALEKLLPDYSELYKKSNALRQASGALAKQNQISAISMSQWDRQFKDAVRTADRVPTSFERMRDSLSNAEKQMDAIFRAAFRMQMVGSQLRMFAQDIIRWGSSIMTTFGDFEFELNRAAGALSIWQKTTVDGQDGTQVLTDSIIDMGTELRLLPLKDVAQAVYFWGSATGQAITTTDQLTTNMKALQEIMKVSTITETGYEETVKGVYSILTQYYHGAVSKAVDVTDLLFYATQKTALEFNDLVNSFKMVGPVAAQANVRFEDMVDLLGRLGDLGIKGTMAGRAFRQMFIQMVKPSGPAKKALEGLFAGADEFKGKSYLDIMFPKGQFVGTEDYIHNLAEALKDLTYQERASLLARISTANELPVLTALVGEEIRSIKNLGNTTRKNLSDIDAAREYTQNAWARFAETWKGTIGAVQRAWEGLQVTIGRAMADALTPMVKIVKDIIDQMQKWAKQPANKQIIEFITKLIGSTAAISAVAGVIATLTGALISIGAVLYVVTKGFGKFVPSLAVFAGAVLALADGVVRNFDMIQKAVQESLVNVQAMFGDTDETMRSMGETMNALLMPTRLVVDALIGLFSVTIKLVTGIGRMLAQFSLLEPTLKIIASLLGTIIAVKMLSGFAMLIGRVTGLSKSMKNAAASSNGAIASIGAFGVAVGNAITKALGIIGLIAGIGTVLYEVFPPFKDWVDKTADSFVSLTDKIQKSIDKLGEMGKVVRNTSDAFARKALGGSAYDIYKKGKVVTGDNGLKEYQTMVGNQLYKNAGGTESSIIADIQKILDQETLDIVNTVNDHYAELNDQLARAGEKPIDMSTFIEKMLGLQWMLPAGANPLDASQILLNVYGAQGMDISREDIQRTLQTIPWVKNLPANVVSAMANLLFNQDIVTAKIDAAARSKQDMIYGPFIDWLSKSASKLSPQYLSTALTQPIQDEVGVAYASLADALLTLSPERQQQIKDALAAAGLKMEDFLGEALEDPVTSALNSAVNSMEGVVSGAMNEHYLGAFNMWQPVIDKITQGIATGNFQGAANAFLGLKGPLLKREFQPAMHEAILKAGEFIIQTGLIDEKTVKEIRGLLEDSAAKEAAKAAEQIRKANEEAWTSAWDSVLKGGDFAELPMLELAAALMRNRREGPIAVANSAAITNFARMLTLGTEGGFKAAIKIFKDDIAPIFDTLPEALQAGIKEDAAQLKLTTNVDLFPDAVAMKSRREWAQQFTQLIPKPDDIRKAIKDFLKHPGRGKKSFKGGANILSSKDFRNIMWGPQSSIESRDAGKQVAVDIINGAIAGFHAAHRPGDKKFYTALLGDLAGDKGVPKWVRRRAQAAIDSIMKDVVVKPPQGTKPGGPLSDVFTAFGLNEAAGKTTKKNPANVWLEVHAKGGTAIKRIMALASQAVTDVTANLAAIAALDWVGTGTTAGTQFGSAILTALKESGNFYRQIQDWSFLVANTDYTVTGTTVGNEIGQGIINGLHQKLGGTATGNKVEVAHTETRNININLNVESKDKSADRANQASVRQGTMDALVAAGLEHDVTIR